MRVNIFLLVVLRVSQGKVGRVSWKQLMMTHSTFPHLTVRWRSITLTCPITLSVTKSAFATDRRFPATLLHACVFLSQSTHPFHPAHARCGDLSFCRFTDLRTASVPAFQPAQTFMTCLTQSGPCCFFFFFFFFLSTERVDERNIKAPTDTSKRRPTTSEDAWVFFMR